MFSWFRATRGVFRSTAGCFSAAVVSKQIIFRGENILLRPQQHEQLTLRGETRLSGPQVNRRTSDGGKIMTSSPPFYSQKDQSAEKNIHGCLPYTKEETWCTRSNLKYWPYTYSLALCTGMTSSTKNVNIPISFPVPFEGHFVARQGCFHVPVPPKGYFVARQAGFPVTMPPELHGRQAGFPSPKTLIVRMINLPRKDYSGVSAVNL